jgi:hypothetical protein
MENLTGMICPPNPYLTAHRRATSAPPERVTALPTLIPAESALLDQAVAVAVHPPDLALTTHGWCRCMGPPGCPACALYGITWSEVG